MMFCQFVKPISISLSPNTERDDISLALKLIFKFQDWQKGKAIQELEEEFIKYLGVKHCFSFNSGRSAFLAILDALGIGEGDEVLLQGFTCNAAVNPILARGATPIFVDVDDTLNLDPADLRKKITPQATAVMIQHNFGWPAQIEPILKIAKEHNLLVIEDCAHSLGAEYKIKKGDLSTEVPWAKTGTFGDMAFFSLGRDKIISSVFGGMAVTNNDELAKEIKEFQEKLDYPSNFWIFQQLLHPILMNYVVIPGYGLNSVFGRLLLGAFHKFSILSKAVYKKEKRGKLSECFPKRFPNALAFLALNQFKKLERFNAHRREIANFYERELKNSNFILPFSKDKEGRIPVFMRYPILAELDTDNILKQARKRKIYLDDGWRKSPVVPPDTKLEKMRYSKSSCPEAEKVAQSILNLPTHINISKKQAQEITDFLKQIK